MALNPEDRRKVILEHCNLSGEGLEYGPLHRLIVDRSHPGIRYVDYADRDTLINHYMGNKNVDPARIPSIDIVTGGKLITNFIEAGTIEYVVASHVVEHVPDLLGWLEANLRVCKTGGVISIVYPDKRYTFDIKRRNSTFSDLLAAYLERRERPTLSQLADQICNACKVTPIDAWARRVNSANAEYINSRESAIKRLRDLAGKPHYTDCHCWVFDDRGFVETLGEVIVQLGFPAEICAFTPTPRNSNEFYLSLRKT